MVEYWTNKQAIWSHCLHWKDGNVEPGWAFERSERHHSGGLVVSFSYPLLRPSAFECCLWLNQRQKYTKRGLGWPILKIMFSMVWNGYVIDEPWWWYSGQCTILLLWRSELKSCWSLQFFSVKFAFKKNVAHLKSMLLPHISTQNFLWYF